MKVTTNRIQLNHEASGDVHGPVIVMSHSLAATHAMWDPQMDVLKNYHIIRCDVHRYGESDAPRID
jgi:3-oxoadipate enol-lactonase